MCLSSLKLLLDVPPRRFVMCRLLESRKMLMCVLLFSFLSVFSIAGSKKEVYNIFSPAIGLNRKDFDVCFKPKDDQNVLIVSQQNGFICICSIENLSFCNCLHDYNPHGIYTDEMTKNICVKNPIEGTMFYVAKKTSINWEHCSRSCPNFSIDDIEAIVLTYMYGGYWWYPSHYYITLYIMSAQNSFFKYTIDILSKKTMTRFSVHTTDGRVVENYVYNKDFAAVRVRKVYYKTHGDYSFSMYSTFSQDVDPPSVPYLFSQFYFTNSVKTISWIIPTICSNEESSVLVYSNSTRLMLTHNIFNIPANELFPNLRLFIEVYTGGSICSVSSFTLEIPSNGTTKDMEKYDGEFICVRVGIANTVIFPISSNISDGFCHCFLFDISKCNCITDTNFYNVSSASEAPNQEFCFYNNGNNTVILFVINSINTDSDSIGIPLFNNKIVNSYYVSNKGPKSNEDMMTTTDLPKHTSAMSSTESTRFGSDGRSATTTTTTKSPARCYMMNAWMVLSPLITLYKTW